MSLFKRVFVEELEVRNPLVSLHAESTLSGGADDTHDIGVFGQYWDGTQTVYTGLFRDASDTGRFKLFDGLQVLPTVDTGVVNTGGAGYTAGSLTLQNIDVLGNAVITGDLTVNGTTTAVNVETLLVEDNLIVANAGPANMKEDGGFVVKRIATNVDNDTAKQTGTASASGTTTTVELQASNGHGTTLDYYAGWIVSFGGDVTGTATVTASTASDPPVLTFDTPASGATTTSTTYSLFNKRYVGTIYDESTDYLTMYGFPREDTEAIIDPAGDAGNGNLADYVNFRARDINAQNNLSVSGTSTLTGNTSIGGNLTVSGYIDSPLIINDNILAINAPLQAEDGGFVVQRSGTNVTAGDTPLEDVLTVGGSHTHTTTTVGSNATLVGGATNDYYNGWYLRFSPTTTTVALQGVVRLVTDYVSTNQVFTVDTALPATPATADEFDLYNGRHAGWIYDEASDYVEFLKFPREIGETDISTTDPAGNVASYINLRVNDLDVVGTFSASKAKTTMVQVSTTTFSSTQIKDHDVIFLNPSANTTYTLPTIASLSLASGEAYCVTFVNINATNQATVSGNGGDTIEGDTTHLLKRQYMKFTLMAQGSNGPTTTWLIV